MSDERFRVPTKETPVRYWRHEDVPGVEFAQTSLDAHTFAPRVESAYTFIYVKRGSVSFELGRRTHPVPAGTLLLVSSGEVCAAHAQEPWQAQIAAVDADIAASITFDLFGRKVLPRFASPLLPTHFAADFVAFWESVALPSSALERESRILILVGDVTETLGELPTEEPGAEERALKLLRAHLWERPADEPPLRNLAHSAQLSVERLRCVFALDRGVDLGTYQHLTRLALAKASLQRGRNPGEVAERVGLDADHLSQEFRRVYRLPPEVYRRSVAS